MQISCKTTGFYGLTYWLIWGKMSQRNRIRFVAENRYLGNEKMAFSRTLKARNSLQKVGNTEIIRVRNRPQ